MKRRRRRLRLAICLREFYRRLTEGYGSHMERAACIREKEVGMDRHNASGRAQDVSPPDGERESATGVTRRALLARGAVLGGVAVAGAAAPAVAAAHPEAEAAKKAKKHEGPGSWSNAPLLPLRFFSGDDYNVISAMANRIFPNDDLGPGATQLGVVEYIDSQLAGAWGSGERMYRQGPFHTPNTTGHGWQYAMTPAGAYRVALVSLNAYTAAKYGGGKTFDELKPAQQDDVLTALETGTSKQLLAHFTQIAPPDFFSLFYENVKEGLFADPSYGGNRGVEGWKLIRYPGDPMARGDNNWKYVLDYNYYPPGPPRPMVAGQ
jgi:gluconate 2-dehydrogenase gamma chain